MKKKILSVLLCLCMVMALLPTTALAASTNISTFTELQTAFSNGGEYTLTQNITVTAQLTLASGKTLTIHGNGHTIQPAVTGLNEQGVVNGDATAIENIIKINSSGILTLDNLTIYGGKGRCIYNSGTLTMTGVSLERAHLTNEFGAGLYNYLFAKALLTNCNIRRNGCDSAGGGFYNYNNGTLILENCAIVENRNFGGGSGGGGGENGGALYMNNCTVANNQSSEIGGGLNNFGGTAYIMNSTFTGNVTTATAKECGGGIGYNGGKVYAVNSAFAFNYANGAASDIGIWNGTNVNLYYCAYGAIVQSNGTTEGSARATCKKLTTGNTNDSVSALFNGARTSGIVDQNGDEQPTTFARPVITQSGSTYGVYPAASSALKSGGTQTYYDRDGFTVKMSYSDPSTALGGLPVATTAVTRPDGSSDTSGLIGSLPTNTPITPMYTVKVNPAAGGTVSGGSAQGNSYPAGTTISITAVPSADYVFSGWKIGASEEISSTANPYSIANLTGDVTLTPVFIISSTSISLDVDENDVYTFDPVTEGYAALIPLTVSVTNTGGEATSNLTVELSGTNAASFTLSTTSISSIAASGGDTFTVVPNSGLAAGTYTATVTVSGTNVGSKSFNVSFTVNSAPVAVYSISLDVDENNVYAFDPVTEGYAPLIPKEVTVTNTGDAATGELTVALSGTNADSFTLNKTSISSIAASGTDTFTVKPNTGLDAGIYTATVTVSGTNVGSHAFDVSFTVRPVGAYIITFDPNDGSVTPTIGFTDGSGNLSSLPTPTRSSYIFNGWYTEASGGTKVETSTVFSEDTTIYAQWTYSGGGGSSTPTYKVESEVSKDADGSVSFSKGNAKKDDTVTITVTPDRYYKVDGVTVKDKNGKEIPVTDNGDGTFTFTMPASKVTVEPLFSWDNPFADVSENAYYAPAVEWALKNEVTSGTGDGTTFSPEDGCTRAQIVTFLWKAAGCPEPAGDNSFADVSADAYYAKAVAWAVEQGITSGTGDGKFSPDAICTRSQSMTFLYHAAGSPEVADSISFSDIAAGSYYADAVVWAAQNGVTSGTSATTFSPNAACTRAQIMTFLYRWMVK